jgi:hypothetical protein
MSEPRVGKIHTKNLLLIAGPFIFFRMFNWCFEHVRSFRLQGWVLGVRVARSRVREYDLADFVLVIATVDLIIFGLTLLKVDNSKPTNPHDVHMEAWTVPS